MGQTGDWANKVVKFDKALFFSSFSDLLMNYTTTAGALVSATALAIIDW